MARSFGPTHVKRAIRHNSLHRGLFGGSRFWLTMFGLGQLVRWSGKVTKRGEMPIRFSERLGPDEAYMIHHVARPKRRDRSS